MVFLGWAMAGLRQQVLDWLSCHVCRLLYLWIVPLARLQVVDAPFSGSLLVFGLVLQQLLDQDVELLPQSLDRALGVLSKLFAVLDLGFEKLSQFLVVVFELLALEGFLEDVLSVLLWVLVAIGRRLGLALPDVSEHNVSEVLDVFNVLHQGVL